MNRIVTLTAATVLAALPAVADLHYETKMTSGGENAASNMDIVARGWVDGERAQVYFVESANPWMKEGMYLYTGDGARTVYLVDPEEETYSLWDLDAILKFAGTLLQGMGPLLDFEIKEPKVEVLSEGPGPTLHGLSTREYEIATSYEMLMKILGMKRSQEIRDVTTIVATDEIDHIAVGMWLRKEPPKTGNAELDKLSENAWTVTRGVPLKWRTDSVMSTKKGKEQRSWSEFEVTKLDLAAGPPPGGYGFPDSYREVSMMPTEAELAGGEAGEEEGKKKKGRFGGLFDGGS